MCRIRLLDVTEACETLRMGKTKLYALIARGELRPIKIGSRTFFDEVEVSNFLSRART